MHIRMMENEHMKQMKAAVANRYGAPDVIEIKDILIPSSQPGEIRVKVIASSVNAGDYRLLLGKPWIIRLMQFGIFRPKHKVLGADIAGIVEAVGDGVTQWQPGDAVLGEISAEGFGAYAEYVCGPAEIFVAKPDHLSFTQAAALPQASLVALQGLRDAGHLQPGHQILINGASGGIGTFAIQLACSMGAEVSAICSEHNFGLVRSLGATQVYDYHTTDFPQLGEQFDLIFDIVARHPPEECVRALKPGGKYLFVGGKVSTLMQIVMQGERIARKTGKKLSNVEHHHNPEDLKQVMTLVESGQVKPVIDQVYPFDRIADALRHYGTGHTHGKVVIKIAEELT